MADLQTETYTIFCVTLGETTEFSVKIPSNDTVHSLKKAIRGKKPNGFAKIDAAQLTLWKLNEYIPSNEIDKRVATLGQNLSEVATKMLPTNYLSDYFPSTATGRGLHVIVELPSLPSAGGKHRQKSGLQSNVLTPLAKKDITGQLVAKWSQLNPPIALSVVHTYLQYPLAEDEKIPIPQDLFDNLSRNALELNAEQLETLFRVSTDERAWHAERLFTNAIDQVPPASGTEELFHSTWDDNISKILRLILSEAEPIRNNNRNTSTALLWPDYGFLVKGSCLFRGEEKGSNSYGDPRRELLDKLQWSYDPLPYILGYHAITTDVNFVAITAPPLTTVPLFNHNLKFKKERVANLVHLIRLSRVVARLGEQALPRGRPEFVEVEREGGLVRMRIGAVVRKEFRHPDAVARVSKLIEIYELLKRKEVPNVDNLNRSNIQANYPHVQLSPVGRDRLPESGSECLNAVVCVLQALKVMHSSPNPVYHRDIRGPNIIKSFDGQGWFLIDWSDASTAPTHAAMHLKESEHSPRIREDNHGAEVDIWGVGSYLENLAYRVTCGIANPEPVRQMARRWMADHAMSAVAALNEINANQHLFTAPAAQTS